MSGLISINNKGQVTCPNHPNNRVSYINLANSKVANISKRLFCEECHNSSLFKKLDEENVQEIKTCADATETRIVISSTDASAKVQDQANFITDFTDYTLEHVIVDTKSEGYAPRGIIYLDDLKILVAGGNKGKVTFWKMNDIPEVAHTLNLSDCVRCSAYIKNAQGRYLALGIGHDVTVYDLNGDKPVHLITLKGNSSVNDLFFGEKTNRLCCAYWNDEIRLYDGSTYIELQNIDTRRLNISSPNATIFLFEDENQLAIESSTGMTLYSLADKSAKHYKVTNRNGFGFGYLKTQREFLLRSKNGDAFTLDRDNLEFKAEYCGNFGSKEFPGYHFKPNEDSSQILTNSNNHSALIYKDDGIFEIKLKGFLGASSGIEILSNLQKFAVADYYQGIIIIFKAGNLNTKTKSNALLTSVITAPSLNSKTIRDKTASPAKKVVPKINKTANQITKKNRAIVINPVANKKQLDSKTKPTKPVKLPKLAKQKEDKKKAAKKVISTITTRSRASSRASSPVGKDNVSDVSMLSTSTITVLSASLFTKKKKTTSKKKSVSRSQSRSKSSRREKKSEERSASKSRENSRKTRRANRKTSVSRSRSASTKKLDSTKKFKILMKKKAPAKSKVVKEFDEETPRKKRSQSPKMIKIYDHGDVQSYKKKKHIGEILKQAKLMLQKVK